MDLWRLKKEKLQFDFTLYMAVIIIACISPMILDFQWPWLHTKSGQKNNAYRGLAFVIWLSGSCLYCMSPHFLFCLFTCSIAYSIALLLVWTITLAFCLLLLLCSLFSLFCTFSQLTCSPLPCIVLYFSWASGFSCCFLLDLDFCLTLFSRFPSSKLAIFFPILWLRFCFHLLPFSSCSCDCFFPDFQSCFLCFKSFSSACLPLPFAFGLL